MSASYSAMLFIQSNSRDHANIILLPCGSMMRQPIPTPSLFMEPSKYRVHILGLVNSIEMVVELEDTYVQLLESTFVQESTMV